MAPLYYDGKVIVGVSGGEMGVRGSVTAYDAKTGQQRRRWMATDPKTYSANSWQGGGAMMDLGCYPLHWLRSFVGTEPEVVSATAPLIAVSYQHWYVMVSPSAS